MMSFGITKFGGTTGHNVRRTAAKGRGGRGIRTAAAPRLPHRGAVPRDLERLESRVLFATATWDGGGLDANWSTAANWVGDVAPLAADDLVFAAGAPQKTNTNDFAAGTTFASITFEDGGYDVSGNGVQLSGGVSTSNATGGNTLGLGLTLTAAQTVNSAIGGTTLTFSGAIDNGGFALTFGGAGDLTASGVISGTGSLAKTGSGVATLSADNTYSGGTSLATGATLYANNTGLGSGTGSGSVSVADTTTLRGAGAASGAVTINAGGALRPGSTSAGTAAFKTGGLTFASSSTLGIDVGGTTAGSQYDQLVVAGSVDLGGSTLALSGSYAAAVGDGFIVVANDGTDTVTGTFSGLAEGALFTFNGATLQVSYAGGDGNDVVLTAVDPNEAPVVSVPGAQAAVEDVSLTLADVNAIQVSDDAGTNPVQVTLSVANGSITLGGTTGLTVSGNGTATVTAAGTLADLNAGLNGSVYTPALNFNGSDTLTASIDDQGHTGAGGAKTDAKTVAITVSAVNDAPVNGVPGAQTTNENTALVFSSANGNVVSVSDVDAGTAAVTATLTVTDGTLTLGATTGFAVSGNGTTTVTATGSLADLNAGLEGLTYNPTTGFSGTATLTVATDDGGNTGSGGALSDSDSLSITVREAGTLQFSDASYSATEDGGTATVTVTRTGGTAGTLGVSYATAAGTAAAGTDYTDTSGTLTFLDGETSKTFSISLLDDLLDEDHETVAMSLSSPTGGADLGAGSATLSITDNDPLPTLSVSDVTVTEGDSGTANAVFTVTLSAASGRSVSVNFATADGTAVGGSDYTAASGTLTFAAGETSKIVTVGVTGDTLFESNETFELNLTAATNATIADAAGAGTIADDESTPPSAFVNDVSVTEGDSGTVNAVFTVQLTEALGTTATVDFGTADGTGLAGTDYVAAAGTVTFLAGETSKTVAVAVKGDLLDEDNETLLFNLSNPTVVAVSDAQSVATVIDNDAAPSVAVGSAVVTEGDAGPAHASFTVSLSAPSGKTVTVDFATEATGEAAANADFTPTSGTLTFAPGDTSKTVSVEVPGDLLDEVDETFELALSNPVNVTVSAGQGIGTIADNDAMPTISIADAAAEERLGGMAFNLSLSAPSGRQVSVDYATAGGTAAAGADFTAAAGTVTFQPGETSKTVVVSVFADGAPEAAEDFTVTLSHAAGATVADGEATGSILNTAPQAVADAAAARPGETIAVPVLANDLDADGDRLLVLAVSDPAGGTAAVAADGTITYTPDATFVGTDSFTYTVGDGNGGTHEAAVTVLVEGTGLVQDPAQPGVTTLVVSADAASNEIRLERVRGGGLRVVIDGVAQDPVQAPDRLVILGGDGDDALVAGRLKVPVLFLGGDGSDTLGGGRKGNVLIGGPGDDTLYGGAGRDILIGGAGADTIRGLGGQDILISGTTAYDEDTAWNRQALRDLLEAWSGRGSVATRLASMRSEAGVGVGGARLTVDTVFDDGAADELIGSGGADAYFTNSEGGAATDILTGRTRTEGLFEV